jgi:hypothetical protein
MAQTYDTLFPPYQATLYADADRAVSQAGLWEWLETFTYRKDQEHLFWSHPNVESIQRNMRLRDEHSHLSFRTVMLAMQFIAKHGWTAWTKDVKFRRENVQ